MHIVATTPLSISEGDIDKEIIEKEREIYREQAINEGKKPEFVEKIVEGRLKKLPAAEDSEKNDPWQLLNRLASVVGKTLIRLN